MTIDPDWRLARAKAEMGLCKFLESDSRAEAEWLSAAVEYLKTITEDFVLEFLPSFSFNPDLDINMFHGAIEATINDLWKRKYAVQAFLNDFNYGRDGSKSAFEFAVRTPELEALWKRTVTDFWFRHAAYIETSSCPSTGAPKPDEPTGNDAGPAVNAADNGGTGRRAAVNAYIEEVFNRTGNRITKTDIWKLARYKSRTEFERWERDDLKHPNKAANQRFTRILTEKPHLK
jgi:hypothetical protein